MSNRSSQNREQKTYWNHHVSMLLRKSIPMYRKIGWQVTPHGKKNPKSSPDETEDNGEKENIRKKLKLCWLLIMWRHILPPVKEEFPQVLPVKTSKSLCGPARESNELTREAITQTGCLDHSLNLRRFWSILAIFDPKNLLNGGK